MPPAGDKERRTAKAVGLERCIALHAAQPVDLAPRKLVGDQSRLADAVMNRGMDAAHALLAAESRRLGLPVADPMRGGAEFDALVEACLTSPNQLSS